MSATHDFYPRHTNCGKPLYRFGYGRDTVTLAMPCFEPTCNTCAWRQPAVAEFDFSSISPRTRPELVGPNELGRRREQCSAAVDQQLCRPGCLHVRHASPVKARKRRVGRVQGSSVSNGSSSSSSSSSKVEKMGPANQRYDLRRRFGGLVVLKFSDRVSQFRGLAGDLVGKRRPGQTLVLKFERRDEFERLSRRLDEGRKAIPQVLAEDRKLFLIIRKNNTLRSRWE